METAVYGLILHADLNLAAADTSYGVWLDNWHNYNRLFNNIYEISVQAIYFRLSNTSEVQPDLFEKCYSLNYFVVWYSHILIFSFSTSMKFRLEDSSITVLISKLFIDSSLCET